MAMVEKYLSAFPDDTSPTLGPASVQIDLDNRCNLGCACCWTYSPSVVPADIDFLTQRMSVAMFDDLVSELASLGTTRIVLAGVGDPMMHPALDDLIAHAKLLGLQVVLTTNGTMLRSARASAWIDIGLDWLNVSVLGPDASTWQSMHPKDDPRLFRAMRDGLVALRTAKELATTDIPGVGLSHVVCKPTVDSPVAAVEMAVDVGANEVNFYGLDHFPEIDALRLSSKDVPRLIRNLSRALVLAERRGLDTNIAVLMQTLEQGGDDTSVGGPPHIPCYHGWAFARVTAQGQVYPCCGAMGREPPLGQIGKESFRSIWESESYKDFRRYGSALWVQDSSAFRARFGCEHCPDVDTNVECHTLLLD